MAIKPVMDVRHRGRWVRVEFAREPRSIAIRYDIFVDDRPVKVGLFAEEVMRWLGEAMTQEESVGQGAQLKAAAIASRK